MERREADRHLATFPLKDLHRFDLKLPFFEPQEIGSFSQNIHRELLNDKSQLKYYIKPPNPDQVKFDLTAGYSTMIRKYEDIKGYCINDILRWILVNKEKFSLQTSNDTAVTSQNIGDRQLQTTDFICWRGLITRVACMPYENRERLILAATLYNGTYYLHEFFTEEKIRERETRTGRSDEMCCWGWKFEQYLTADKPDGIPDLDSPYNNIEGFDTVVRSQLNSHSLVFAGEVDCMSTDKAGNPHYLELKTTRKIETEKQDYVFKRFKLIKWWLQSFLVGIPEIVCGYRDDNGIVHRLETLSTHKIPSMAKDIHNPWKPCVCLNFLDQFLTFVKQTVMEDNHRTFGVPWMTSLNKSMMSWLMTSVFEFGRLCQEDIFSVLIIIERMLVSTQE